MKKYSTKIESEIKIIYARLSEKDQRRYAAAEANKLGFNGKNILVNY